MLHRGFWRYKPEHYRQNKKVKDAPKISAAAAFNDAIDAALHISQEDGAYASDQLHQLHQRFEDYQKPEGRVDHKRFSTKHLLDRIMKAGADIIKEKENEEAAAVDDDRSKES